MKNSEQAINQLNTKLREYIQLKGYKFDGKSNINCIHPEHEDRHPSCHIFKTSENSDVELLYCFSCRNTFNIFHAAYFMEGLPLSGREFFNITVPTLCKYFNIEYEPDELSEDDREAYTRKRAYRDATNIICDLPKTDDDPIIERIYARNYDRVLAKNNYIGGIKSFDNYLGLMKDLGWDEKYLAKIDLLNKGIFNSNNLIFAIRNENGEPVGFVARRVPWTKSSGVSKFENSPNSDIYRKGHILYGLDKAKRIKAGPLWIVEGYPDTITLIKNGIKKVAGIGGIAFTEDHRELLNRLEIYDIIICLDGDSEGIKATENTIEKLAKYKCFNIKIVEIPFNLDPDDYIKEHGIDKFKELSQQTPFEWMLRHSDSTGSDLVNKTLPIVMEEKNHVTRLEMCKALSHLSGVDLEIIRREIDRRENENDNKFQEKIDNLKERCVYRLQKEKVSFKTILEETMRDHRRFEKLHQTQVEEDEEYSNRYKNLKEKYLSNPELLGYKLSTFPKFQKELDGIPKTQSLIAIAGKPNVGKTSFLRYLAYDLVRSNDDVVVLFMTIDDNYEKTITPFVALDQGLDIAEVRKPTILLGEEKLDKFHEGWKNINNIQKEKLFIRDVTSGNDLSTLERHITKFYNKFPDKKLLVILDNFHKLSGSKKRARRESIIDQSERIKEISNIFNIPIIMTVELNKMYESRRPRLDDISESKQIEYDCDIIMLMHNELHDNKYTHVKWHYGNEIMPILEINIAKNKETSSKELLVFKFITTKSYFEEANMEEFSVLMQKSSSINDMKQSIKDYQNDNFQTDETSLSSMKKNNYEKGLNRSMNHKYLNKVLESIKSDGDLSNDDKEQLKIIYNKMHERLSYAKNYK